MRYPTIFRYLFRQHMWLALLVLGCLFLIVMLGQFADMSRYQSELPGWSSLQTMTLAFYRSPTLMQAILQHVVLISAALTVARAGRRLELAVMMQNGLSPPKLLLPVVLAAMVLGAVFSWAVNPLASMSFAYSETVLKQVAGVVSDASHREPREMVLRQPDGGALYVLVEHVPPDPKVIYGLSVIRVDRLNAPLQSLEAVRAVEAVGGWHLQGVRELFRAEDLAPAAEIGDRLIFSTEALGERYDNEQAVSVYRLPQKIALARAVGAPSRALQVRLGWLLALPVLLGAVAWLAGAIVIRPLHRGAWKGDAALVLTAAFTIYTLSTVFDALGVRGIVPVWVSTGALPVACVVAGAALLWLKRGGNRILLHPFLDPRRKGTAAADR